MINPIPGQEEENAEYLEEMGLAVWVRAKDNFETIFKEVIQDKKLNELKQNGQKLAGHNSALEICEEIFGWHGFNKRNKYHMTIPDKPRSSKQKYITVKLK